MEKALCELAERIDQGEDVQGSPLYDLDTWHFVVVRILCDDRNLVCDGCGGECVREGLVDLNGFETFRKLVGGESSGGCFGVTSLKNTEPELTERHHGHAHS